MFAMFGQSISHVWLGVMLVLFFAVQLHWFPVMGVGGFKNIILPAFTMGTGTAALLTRMLRSGMIDVLKEDYITSTFAKGIARSKIIGKYAFRNAIMPYIVILGIEVGHFLGGAVVTEQIFAWPGIGTLTVQAINMRDFPLIQSILLVTSALFVFILLLVDIIHTLIDPRLTFN